MRRVLSFVVLIAACGGGSSAAPPPKPATASSVTGPACPNACMASDAQCHDKCLEEEPTPPKDDEDSCGGKCTKALERCIGSCR